MSFLTQRQNKQRIKQDVIQSIAKPISTDMLCEIGKYREKERDQATK